MPKPIVTAQFRLSCAIALLTLSGQSNSAIPEPIQPQNNKDWTSGSLLTNSAYALGVSHWNFLRYFEESKARYGALPPQAELTNAIIGWDTYISSNIPRLSIFVRKNNPPDNGGGWTISTPNIPLVNRIVTPVNKAEGFRKPLLPPMRLTHDGRIGVVPGSGGLDGKPQPLRIRLNRPEALNKHFLNSHAGVPTLDPLTLEVSDYSKWGLPGSKTTHFASICEGGTKKNPYTCGANGKDDCYDLTLVGSAVKESFTASAMYELKDENGNPTGYQTLYMPQLENGDRVYSRAMTIRVSQPKTAQARIASVDFGTDYKQSPMRQGVLYELNTPADGRLLVTRRQGLPLVWRHSTTGQMRAGSYETVYAVAPDNAAPCDASQWGDLRPLSHAPYDPLVNKKYPFAKYPFRDPMGNYIPDGEDIKATYPWVDMDAKNISLMVSDANLFRDGFVYDKSRFANSCVHSGCTPSDSTDKSNVSQFTIMGSWTKGKMSLIDNKLNYADFRINLANAVNLDLYQPNSALSSTSNKSASVEVGAYREVGGGTPKDQYIQLKDETGQLISEKYLMKNTSLFDSIENRMNFNPYLKPAMPSDVVWLLSSGATSDEFSFDDLLNNNAFIVSDMTAAYSWVNDSRFRMTGFDGWNETLGQWRGQVKVQNAATTLPEVWRVPIAGDVLNGRIEPVANGGIKGKGFYFNGINTQILYDIPLLQPRALNQSPWFHSVFLDAREVNKDSERVIINFPDNSRLTMTQANDGSYNIYGYNQYGERQVGTSVPASFVKERWLNLGLQIQPSKNSILFVNGYPYGDLVSLSGAPSGGSLFQMKGGDLVLGRAHNAYDKKRVVSKECGPLGLICLDFFEYSNVALPTQYATFKGWMDEYKVFSYVPDFESICNLSHGTLVAVGTNTEMKAQAALYLPNQHNRVTAALQARGQNTYSQYACYLGDRLNDKTAVVYSLPLGSVGIRANMHFPEGPLYHNKPRPDSTKNEFCLACHTDASHNLISGLSKTSALGFRAGTIASTDPRRQPTQPPAQIHGNLPAEFFRSIGSNAAATSGTINIDEYILKTKP